MAQRHATLCDGLEHAGLEQERRALVARPADMRWEWPQADQLVLTFSLPNFYFHLTTAYDILRHNGVPIGKADFFGRQS